MSAEKSENNARQLYKKRALQGRNDLFLLCLVDEINVNEQEFQSDLYKDPQSWLIIGHLFLRQSFEVLFVYSR